MKDVSLILLVVSGAGGLKQVFTDSGASGAIAEMMGSLPLSPLVQGWLMAAIIRVAMGSATVAGLTTAGIIAPVVATTGVDPSLMVLSIGAGSLMFSHVNDSGFWMFKEYFNLSIRDTIRSWSLMETIVSVTGRGDRSPVAVTRSCDERGMARFPLLPEGGYAIRAEAAGRGEAVVEIEWSRSVPLPLQVKVADPEASENPR